MRGSRRAQRGVALLGLLAVAVMVFAYVLVSRLNAASQFIGIDRDHNAKVMARAKQALVGWMAVNAAGSDNNPGRLPCPQAWADIGTVNEGRAAGNCSAPAVGWLPWRTLGLDRPLDAAGNQIWYVISPGWHLPNVTTTLSINSDDLGQLSLDGTAAVALLIAPGPPLALAPNADQVAAGCAARNQSQVLALPGTSPDPLDFLECQNGTTADNVFTASVVDNIVNPSSFTDTEAKQVFNDQVLAITTADVMPALEAAIAERMQREIAPALRGIYASAPWKRTATNFLTTSNPLYPFPARFIDPGASSYRGEKMLAPEKWQGLLPVVYSETSPGSGLPCTGDPRCDPLFVRWTGGTLSGPSIYSASCSVVTSTTTRLDCTFYYRCLLVLCTPPNLNYIIQAQADNVGMALRQVNMSAPIGSANVTASIFDAEALFSSAGGVSLTLSGTATPTGSGSFLSALLGNTFCGLPLVGSLLGCKQSLISVPIGVLADHPILDPSSIGAGATGWFLRNEWYRLTYYAAAEESTPDGLPNHGCDSTDCLLFNNVRNIRSLLVLAGRSINGAVRPNGSLGDYLEYDNGDFGTAFEGIGVGYMQRAVRMSKAPIAAIQAPFNDRVVLVDWSWPLQEPVQVADDSVPSTRVRLAKMLP